jgi:zinc resistance-associated protein
LRLVDLPADREINMKPWMFVLAGFGALAAGDVVAQDRSLESGPFRESWGSRGRLSAEDRDTLASARIAALHAGLKLNADQQKRWPPVEAALRTLVQQRREAREAGRERFAAMRQDGAARDVPGMLREIADRQLASAEALRKLADAVQPLHSSLDEGQKRRLTVLSRGLVPCMADQRRPRQRGALEGGSGLSD